MNSLLKEILDPCQIEIIVRKGNASIKVTSLSDDNVNEQDTLEIKSTSKENSQVVFNLGITQVGGTDNWGIDSDPIILAYNKDAHEGDGILVDHIIVGTKGKDNNIFQPKKDDNDNEITDSNGNTVYEIIWDNGNYVDWCKCEQLNDGLLMYTATSANNSTLPRTAYFYHQTISKTITRKGHLNYGYEVLQSWYVTVIQNPNPYLVSEAEQSLIDKVANVTKEASVYAAETIMNIAGQSVEISDELRNNIYNEAINIATKTAKDLAKNSLDEAEREARAAEMTTEERLEKDREETIQSIKDVVNAEKEKLDREAEQEAEAKRTTEREAKKAEEKVKIAAKEAEREAARNLAKSSR